MFRGKPIPCWFISEETPELVRRGWTDKPTKRIRKGLTVWRGEQFIDSPAEKAYREAEQGRKADDVVVDYGVVLRFTEAGRTSVVIAGIHQYGTWIAGYFMDRLVRDKDYHSEIPRGEDFLAVVWGRFNSGTLQVEDGGVARRLWWIRKGRTGKIEDWLLAGKASTQSEDTVFPEATLAADGATTA
jgi:hypothetical protein